MSKEEEPVVSAVTKLIPNDPVKASEFICPKFPDGSSTKEKMGIMKKMYPSRKFLLGASTFRAEVKYIRRVKGRFETVLKMVLAREEEASVCTKKQLPDTPETLQKDESVKVIKFGWPSVQYEEANEADRKIMRNFRFSRLERRRRIRKYPNLNLFPYMNRLLEKTLARAARDRGE